MTEDPRRRGGYAKGRATRAVVLGAAIELFGEVGFHGASLRDIAARAGISHSGLLHHFPTKTALLEAVLAHRDELDAADIEAEVAAGKTWLEGAAALVGRNQERRALVEVYVALSAEATSPEHPAHAYFVDRYQRVLAFVRADFEQLQARGELRAGVDPEVAARTVVALMDGLQVQWLLTPAQAEPFVMADLVRGYLRQVVRARAEVPLERS